MPNYLAEFYSTGPGSELEDAVARVERAAREIAAEGRALRLVRSSYAADDEICFHVFEAESSEVIDEVGRRAGLLFDHVAETTPVGSGESASSFRREEES